MLAAAVVTWSGPSRAAPTSLLDLENAISDVAEQVKPCVVSLSSQRNLPDEDATPFNLPRRSQPTPRFPEARGSGMLFRATDQYYYILTNAHVVRGARGNRVDVKLVTETSKRHGVVLGVDRPTDAAVVRMDRKPGENLPMAKFGSPKALRVGSLVLAIGSPFDFEASVTLGIVSSLDRTLDEPSEGEPAGIDPTSYTGLIQTDASINPGNSGGPLVNVKGEVVGINFAIFSPGVTGSNIGIGFAIPIDRALAVVDDLISKGHAVRGYLGVLIADADFFVTRNNVALDDVKAMYGTTEGAFVRQVQVDTPAAQAGMQAGDVIVSADGQTVKSVRELQDHIRDDKPGTQVRLGVLRNKKPLELNVTLGELPAALTGDVLPGPGGVAPPTPPKRDALGVTAQELSPQQAADLKIPQGYGVRVTQVNPDGLAAAAGITANTVLIEGRMDGGDTVQFKTLKDYQDFIAKAEAAKAFVELRISTAAAGNRRVEQTVTLSFKQPANDNG